MARETKLYLSLEEKRWQRILNLEEKRKNYLKILKNNDIDAEKKKIIEFLLEQTENKISELKRKNLINKKDCLSCRG